MEKTEILEMIFESLEVEGEKQESVIELSLCDNKIKVIDNDDNVFIITVVKKKN